MVRRHFRNWRDYFSRRRHHNVGAQSSQSAQSAQSAQIVISPFIAQSYTTNIKNIGTNTVNYSQVVKEYDFKTQYSDGWYILPDDISQLQPLSSTVISNGLVFRLLNWSKNLYLYRDDGTVLVNNIPVIKTNVATFNFINFTPIEYSLTYFQLRTEPLPTTSYIRIVKKIDDVISETMYNYGEEPIKLGPYKPNDTIVIYIAYNTSKYLPNLFKDIYKSELSPAMGYQRNLNYNDMNVYKYVFEENIDEFYLIPSLSLPIQFLSYRNNIPLNIDISFNDNCNPIPKLGEYTLLPTNNPSDYNSFNGSGLYVNLFTDFECKIKANESESVQRSSLYGYDRNVFAYNEHQNANYYKLLSQEDPVIQPQMYDSIDGSGQRIYINPDNPALCMKLPYESTEFNPTSTDNNGYDISYYTDPDCTNQYIDAQYNVDNNQNNNTDYTSTNINGEPIENSNARYFRVYKQP